MSQKLSLIDLTPGDIERLPDWLCKRIGDSSRLKDSQFGAWLLVGERPEGPVELFEHPAGWVAMRNRPEWSVEVHERPEGFKELLERTFEALLPHMIKHRNQLSEANIEKILDGILSDAPRPWVENELEIDNAFLRSRYLQETPLLTGAEVRATSGLNPRNKSEPASRWKREGKLFAVRRSGVDHYPAFQFVDGSPRPVIKAILDALPRDMTGWQIAMWFASGNGWLDGDEPKERLSDPDAVVDAARRLADPALG